MALSFSGVPLALRCECSNIPALPIGAGASLLFDPRRHRGEGDLGGLDGLFDNRFGVGQADEHGFIVGGGEACES